MTSSTFAKDPDERLDYDFDFSRWLTDSDTIASAVAVRSGGSVVLDAPEIAAQSVRVWVSGGAIGEASVITVRATTAQGRVKESAMRLKIKGTM